MSNLFLVPVEEERGRRGIVKSARCLEYKEGDAKRSYLPGLAKSFDCSKFNPKLKSETPFCSQSLHSCDIVIQRSGSYTTVISAWIVENTEKAGNLANFLLLDFLSTLLLTKWGVFS